MGGDREFRIGLMQIRGQNVFCLFATPVGESGSLCEKVLPDSDHRIPLGAYVPLMSAQDVQGPLR